MSYSEELGRIFEGDNNDEQKQAISVIFALIGKRASEIKREQDRLGKPRALKKMLGKAEKLQDNEEETERLTALYQESLESKSSISDNKKLLSYLKDQQKQLSKIIKKG